MPDVGGKGGTPWDYQKVALYALLPVPPDQILQDLARDASEESAVAVPGVQAQSELWRPLVRGDIDADGISDRDERRVRIPKREFMDLSLQSAFNYDVKLCGRSLCPSYIQPTLDSRQLRQHFRPLTRGQSGTIKAETDCERYLRELLLDKKSPLRTIQKEYEDAKKRPGLEDLSFEAFKRALRKAQKATDNYSWSASGPRGPRQNSSARNSKGQ